MAKIWRLIPRGRKGDGDIEELVKWASSSIYLKRTMDDW